MDTLKKDFFGSQIILGVVRRTQYDENNNPTGIYTVQDVSTGVLFTAVAMQVPGMVIRYSRGDMVVVAVGVPPATKSDWSGIILGSVNPEANPLDMVAPSPYSPEEGDFVLRNPLTDAMVRSMSTGDVQIRGRIQGTSDTADMSVGGEEVLSVHETTYSLHWKVGGAVEWFLHALRVILDRFLIFGRKLSVVVKKSIELVSQKTVLILSDKATLATEGKVEVMGKDGVVLKGESQSETQPVARAPQTAEHLQRIYAKFNTDLIPKLSALGVVVSPFTPMETDTSGIYSDSVEVD